MKIKPLEIFIISLILAVGLYFNFYHHLKLYPYNYDQERDYQAISEMVSLRKPALIGPRAVASSGFYLGPWYYYLLLPFYLLSGGDPFFAAYFAGFFNLLIGLSFYLVLRRHISKLTALTISLFWFVAFRRVSWNVTLIPLFTLSFVHFLLLKKPKRIEACLFYFLVALGINFHFQIIFMLPVLVVWTLYHRRQLSLSPRTFLLLFLSFVSPFMPLIIFDLRHQWVNITGAYHYFTQDLTYVTTFYGQMAFSARQFLREIDYILPPFYEHRLYKVFLLPFLYLVIVLYSFIKKKHRLLALLPNFFIIALAIYSQTNWPEYYHLMTTIFFLSLLGLVFDNTIISRLLLFGLLLAVIIPSGKNIASASPGDSFYYKRQVIQYILKEASPNRPDIVYDFNLGDGYGFGTLRDFYEDKSLTFAGKNFYVSYYSSPKHNQTKKVIGAFAVSSVSQ